MTHASGYVTPWHRPGLQYISFSGEPAFTYYVDPDAGSDGNNGRTQATAFQTLSAVPSGAGVRVGLKPNAIHRGKLALSGAGMAVQPWASNARSAIWNSTRHSSGWTQVGATNEWTKNIGYGALNVFLVASSVVGAAVTKYIRGTVTSLTAGQYGVSGSSVYVYAASDPNGLLFEIPVNTSDAIIASSADNTSVSNLDLWFGPQNGIDVASGANFTATATDTSYNANDGVGVQGTASGVRLLSGWTRRNGQLRTLSGGAGDGVSFHVTSTGLIQDYVIVDNEKCGIANQVRTSVDTVRSFLKNNNNEWVILNEGTTTAGTHRLIASVIVWTATNGGSDAVQVTQGAISNLPTVEILNCTIYRAGGASKRGVRNAAGNTTLKNTAIVDFDRGIDFRGTDSGTLNNDYNCMFGNATNYFNNGTPGVTAGAHDTTADPLFVNASNDDFSIQAGSSCIGAGVAVGVALDRANRPYAAPPSIGAYEAA